VEFKGDQNLKTYYENSKQGWRLAASVGGALTGYRGDRIIVDDPHDVRSADSDTKREDAIRWFTETLPTRLNNQQTSAMVCVMQRLHERDVSGLIQRELTDDWEQLVLPMEFESSRRCIIQATGWTDPRKEDGELLWPERFSRESVEELKKTFRAQGGTYAEAAQLQQRPAPREGGLFRRDEFQVVDIAPTNGRTVRGWDLAASTGRHSAYTVGIKLMMSMGKLYILDVVRLRGTPSDVENAIRTAAQNDGQRVAISLPQDPGQAGKAQRSRLAAILHGYNVHFSPETGSKDDRAIPVAAQAEAGNLYMVRAPWNDALLAEAQMFPASEFKDQIDALSRSYAYLLTQNTRSVALEPPMIITRS
jgi:predicted phage terminase large subunit-like protein